MVLLQKEMTGTAIGSLGENADVPPVVLDFQVQCNSPISNVCTKSFAPCFAFTI